MEAVYGDEESGLHIREILLPFLAGHARSLLKRIGYMYFLRNFSVASLELLLGLPALILGVLLGLNFWSESLTSGQVTTSGEVMLAALPIIVGTQLLLAFLQFDVAAVPTEPLARVAADKPRPPASLLGDE